MLLGQDDLHLSMQVGRSTLALAEMPVVAKNTDAPAASATNFMVGTTYARF